MCQVPDPCIYSYQSYQTAEFRRTASRLASELNTLRLVRRDTTTAASFSVFSSSNFEIPQGSHLSNMSRATTSIELVNYPETPLPALTAKPPSKAQGNDPPSIAEDLQPINGLPITFSAEQRDTPGEGTTAIVLVTVVCVTLVSSMLSGVMTVTLPTVARELELAPSVLLWYMAKYQ
jgi:hypothetical protein